jgi:hypothetical protein
MVTVIVGANEMKLNIMGKTIAQVREDVKALLGLTGTETVKLNGELLVNAIELEEGDELEFVKASGEKGC